MGARNSTTDWAAIVPWSGVQNPPAQLTGIVTANPPQATTTVTIPKLTGGGVDGFITFINGVLTASRSPT